MKKGNLPILYQNIMFGLSSDLACDAFLWAVERPDEGIMCYRAENFAHEVDNIVCKLTPMLDAGSIIHGMAGHDPDLINFILVRHANWRFGGNQRPTYQTRVTA